MTAYRVELVFTDIDGSMYTEGQASVVMTVNADDLTTAYMLANHLQKILGADYHNIDRI